ncbi:MAG: hypothetical protein LBF13_04190 [Campylobacteraceae bacterium]|jgi:hypothetical protein|nr:hypothetical protein [Campylobacteraceae bacterium]
MQKLSKIGRLSEPSASKATVLLVIAKLIKRVISEDNKVIAYSLMLSAKDLDSRFDEPIKKSELKAIIDAHGLEIKECELI